MTISEAIEQQIRAAEAFEKSALEEGVSELTREGRKKVASEHRQIAEWLMELKEAKKLLKASVEDLNTTAAEVYNGGVICKCCKWQSPIGKCSCPDDGGCNTDYRWRYADEALKLIES